MIKVSQAETNHFDAEHRLLFKKSRGSSIYVTVMVHASYVYSMALRRSFNRSSQRLATFDLGINGSAGFLLRGSGTGPDGCGATRGGADGFMSSPDKDAGVDERARPASVFLTLSMICGGCGVVVRLLL